MIKSLAQRAQKFAEIAHEGQFYGDEEYAFSHLPEVVKVLADFGYDSEVWQARGWLHDVMEDTQTSVNYILEDFGSEVAWPCWAVSGFGPSRKIRNADIKTKLGIYGFDAQVLKVADRIANCERGAKNDMYRKEYPEFKMATLLVPLDMHDRLERALNITQHQEV